MLDVMAVLEVVSNMIERSNDEDISAYVEESKTNMHLIMSNG